VNGIAATSDVFRLTGVTILPGTQAPTAAQSPLIMRPYDQELLTCQRYYQSWGNAGLRGQAVTATNAMFLGNLVPRMRGSPAATLTSTTPTIIEAGVGTKVGAGSAIASSQLTPEGMAVEINGFTGMTARTTVWMTFADMIKLDARL